MVRRTSTVRRRGLTAYKLVELLTGEIMYPVRHYDGYGTGIEGGGEDDLVENYISDAMRQDWEANREALLAFWRSGKHTLTDTLAEFGLNVSMPPWLYVRGSPRTLPWAAKQFDRARGAAPVAVHPLPGRPPRPFRIRTKPQ
jgi:hypothetical protein